MTVDWWTLALQAVNFLILVWLLRRFLYHPVRDVLDRRKAMAEEAFAEADRKKGEADSVRAALEAERAAFAEERQNLLRDVHRDLEGERQKTLDAAREEAGKLVDAAQARIAQEREVALQALRHDAAGLAGDLAAEILAHAASGIPAEASLDAVERQVQALAAEERERLENDLAAEGARLTVVTAAPLPAESRGPWRERLAACFGPAAAIDFTADPTILGGVELHFPHAVLRFT
jgi:ATP synthase F0 subunit b